MSVFGVVLESRKPDIIGGYFRQRVPPEKSEKFFHVVCPFNFCNGKYKRCQ
jgi:hypothetical protein